MRRVIKTHRFDFSGKDTTQTEPIEFDGKVESVYVAMSGFSQEFSDSGQNVRTAAAYVKAETQVSIVNLTAVLDIQPTNKSTMNGWIEALIIADVS